MSYYYVLDIVFYILVLGLSYYAYKEHLYQKLFDYFKIFILITISAKLASHTGVYLQKFSITKADSYSILLLISFAINFIILFYGYNTIFIFMNKFINSNKFRSLCAKTVTLIEVSVITTFLLYVSMQFYPSKKYLYNSVQKSFSYHYIDRFYTHFLNDDFTYMILNSNSAINHKEVLFNSFKKAL